MENQTKINILLFILIVILFLLYIFSLSKTKQIKQNELIETLSNTIENPISISNRYISSNDSQYPYIRDRCVMLSCNNKYQGSGFFIKENYIVTCAHVVSTSENNKVELCKDIYSLVSPSHITYKCDIVCVDTISDIAVLKISNDSYNQSLPKLNNQHFNFETNEIKTSDNITVVGYPLGINSFSLSSGKIRDSKFVSSTMFIPTDMILINCPVYQGNSGSPVINENGNVVSILNFVYQNNDKIYEGFGGGVKCDILSHIVNQMIEFDTNPSHPSYDAKNKLYKRAFLGLTNTKMILFYNIPTLREKYNFKENKAIGFRGNIATYKNNLPSDFNNNNIITKIDGKEVGIFDGSVGNVVLKKNIGDTISIEYYQMNGNNYENKPRTTRIKLEAYPKELYAKEDMKSYIQYECNDEFCSKDIIMEEKINNYL